MTKVEKIQISAEDDYILSANLFSPLGDDKNRTIVITSATGVRKEYYQDFASFLSGNGYRVVTFDYRGIGESLVGDIRDSKATMVQWGDLDVSAVLAWISQHFPEDKVFYIGHSIGAHIVGLARHTEKISGTILVSSGCAYWRNYGVISRSILWLTYFIVFPLCLKFLRYFPSKFFGLGDNLPPKIAANWGSWGRKEDYIYSDHPSAMTRIRNLQVPVLAYSFKDDRLASVEAVKKLVDIYPNTAKQWNHIRPSDVKLRSIGHNGYFRKEMEATLWQDTLNWMDGIR